MSQKPHFPTTQLNKIDQFAALINWTIIANNELQQVEGGAAKRSKFIMIWSHFDVLIIHNFTESKPGFSNFNP